MLMQPTTSKVTVINITYLYEFNKHETNNNYYKNRYIQMLLLFFKIFSRFI